MRFRSLLLVLLPCAVAASAADLSVVRVFTGWREAASFKRISEYFDGRENTGGQIVLRTHPDQRGGYYFLVRLANSGPTQPVKIALEVIAPGETKTRSYTFAADLGSGESVLNLGLTGNDWPNAKSEPVAWKLVFLSADNRPLAAEKSYLWEKPGTP